MVPRNLDLRWLTVVLLRVTVLSILGLFLQANAAHSSSSQRVCSAEPTDDLISYGDMISCDINPGSDQDQFRFGGTLGEVVVIQALRQGATTVCMELLRPDGTTIEPRTCGNFVRFDTSLDQSGEYQVRVESAIDVTISYSLVVDRVVPVSPEAEPLNPGLSFDGNITPPGEIDFYAFDGEVGDTISIIGTDTSGTTAVTYCELIDPNGDLIQFSPSCVINQTLTQSGIHSILVYEGGNNQEMTYTLDYSCSGTCLSLSMKRRYLDSQNIEDINFNNSPEIVSLFRNRNTKDTFVMIKDGSTGAVITSIKVFKNMNDPIGMASIGDQTGDLISEIGVLAINHNNGAIRVWVVDPVLRTVTTPMKPFYNSDWTPIAITRVQDLNDDGIDETGVMAMNKISGKVKLKVMDMTTGTPLKKISYPQ